MAKTDYYKILGVHFQASEEEIRRAYLRLAMKWHPDKHQDSEEATAHFQQISDAYETLSDPDTREEYDEASEWHVDEMTVEEYLARFNDFILTINGLGLAMEV